MSIMRSVPGDQGLDWRVPATPESDVDDRVLAAHARHLAWLIDGDLAGVAAAAEETNGGWVALATVREVTGGRTFFRAGAASGVDRIRALWEALLDAVVPDGSLLRLIADRWRAVDGVVDVTVVLPGSDRTSPSAALVDASPSAGVLAFRTDAAEHRVLTLPNGEGVAMRAVLGADSLLELDDWLSRWTQPE